MGKKREIREICSFLERNFQIEGHIENNGDVQFIIIDPDGRKWGSLKTYDVELGERNRDVRLFRTMGWNITRFMLRKLESVEFAYNLDKDGSDFRITNREELEKWIDTI